MRALIRLLSFFHPLSQRISLCGNIGFIAGLLAGLVLSTLAWAYPGFYMTDGQALIHASVLTLFTWIVALFLLCVLAKLTFKSVAWPALISCLLTCFALTFICKHFDIFADAWLVGMVIGTTVGMLLCWLNAHIKKG